jgi:hypothetical protein
MVLRLRASTLEQGAAVLCRSPVIDLRKADEKGLAPLKGVSKATGSTVRTGSASSSLARTIRRLIT